MITGRSGCGLQARAAKNQILLALEGLEKKTQKTPALGPVRDLLVGISHTICQGGGMARKRPLDDLDLILAERAKRNPELAALVAARTNRRILQHQLARRRVEVGMTQTEAGAAMKTSQSAIARLESGEHDVRMSTLERYAVVLGCAISMSLDVAS